MVVARMASAQLLHCLRLLSKDLPPQGGFSLRRICSMAITSFGVPRDIQLLLDSPLHELSSDALLKLREWHLTRVAELYGEITQREA